MHLLHRVTAQKAASCAMSRLLRRCSFGAYLAWQRKYQ